MLNAMQYNLGMAKLTTRQAAERLGKTEQAVRNLIGKGRINAEKFGSVWAIDEEEIERFLPAKIGRPRKRVDNAPLS